MSSRYLQSPAACPDCTALLQPWRIADSELSMLRCTQCEHDWLTPAGSEVLARGSRQQAACDTYKALSVQEKQALAATLAESEGRSSSSPLPLIQLLGLLGLPLPEYQHVKLPFATVLVIALCISSWLFVDQSSIAYRSDVDGVWRAVLAGFAHADVWHLLGNLYFLAVFGVGAETVVPRRFLLPALVLGGGIAIAVEGLVHPDANVLGASAAVSVAIGIAVVRLRQVRVALPVLGAFGVYGPLWLFGGVELAWQVGGVACDVEGTAFIAHMVGLVVGIMTGAVVGSDGRGEER